MATRVVRGTLGGPVGYNDWFVSTTFGVVYKDVRLELLSSYDEI